MGRFGCEAQLPSTFCSEISGSASLGFRSDLNLFIAFIYNKKSDRPICSVGRKGVESESNYNADQVAHPTGEGMVEFEGVGGIDWVGAVLFGAQQRIRAVFGNPRVFLGSQRKASS